MFDLGFWEVLILCLIGLLVLGPERMARTVRVLGRWTGKARASFNSARSEVERELRVEEIRKAGESVRQDVEETRRALKGAGEDLERESRGARRASQPPRTDSPGGDKRRPEGEEQDP